MRKILSKKYYAILTVFAALSSAFLLAGLCACSDHSDVTLYDVATELGYESETSWLSSVTGTSSELRGLYDEAVELGYEGTFVEFLAEIGYTGSDHSASLAGAVMSVVSIHSIFTEYDSSYSNFMRPSASQSTKQVYSAGSGIIYSLDKDEGDAYIVTNYHVVYDADSTGAETIAHISDEIDIWLYGSLHGSSDSAIAATYVGGTMEYDIAVLKVEDSEILKNSSASAAVSADSDAISVGSCVYAAGNAEDAGITVTEGVVSVEAEYISMLLADDETEASMLEIRTDAAVNHGNSGGGLFNADGKLIGIVNARSEEDGVEAFGYAIPSNLALSVAQNIIDNSKTNSSYGALRAMLGITIQVTDSTAVYDGNAMKTYIVETVTVKEVSSTGVAYGKIKAGDILYSIAVDGNAEKVITRRHVIEYSMFNVRKDSSVEMVVYRGGETISVNVLFDEDSYFTLYN